MKTKTKLSKEITIDGKKFLYKNMYNDIYGGVTHFYDTEYIIEKGFISGEKYVYDIIFSVSIDIEYPGHTKDFVREKINKAYGSQLEYVNRENEIKRGEII
jgi:hypothetical protein